MPTDDQEISAILYVSGLTDGQNDRRTDHGDSVIGQTTRFTFTLLFPLNRLSPRDSTPLSR